ncbi:stage VI sporulation protein F [Halalkalibacterium halodurans]|uniref:stage VI sporulation protein F n=1 Tax=Halalkalibacterium halodurans TaxID=86665 RepID=UPI0010676587|nr:stage VI sporulation protein F [Halalkalibacterium halodurans]TES57721.1 stage VI sporulation protein F [Halalkalibacterium halodurans]
MSQNERSFFDHLKNKTNVNPADLFKLADSVSQANLRDEKTVRQLITQVSRLANVPVPKEKEDQIVKAILNNDVPTDLASLTKMFNNTKK